MGKRQYYSVRTGKNPKGTQLELKEFKRLFISYYNRLEGEGYFQEDFGFECVDAGVISGSLGNDIEAEILLAVRKEDLWPIRQSIEKYSIDDLFDMIEFLYDHVSKPTKRSYHSWSDCGWHCEEFDKSSGQAEFRQVFNPLLNLFDTGFELSSDGHVLSLPDEGLDALIGAQLPTHDTQNVDARVEAAVSKFRRSRANLDERRDAIRDLADVLEYLRPQAKQVLQSEDERDLFNLANNFGLRHHNTKQKTKYDKPIWYSWLFYHYLATIHALTRMILKKEK